MTEDSNSRTLAINIIPKIDVEAFKESIQAALEASGMSSSEGGGKFAELMEEVKAIRAAVQGKPVEKQEGEEPVKSQKDRKPKDVKEIDIPGESKKDKDAKRAAEERKKQEEQKRAAIKQLISTAVNMVFTGIQRGFGIVQQIYGKIKQSSAFLQTVENLFNLAMTLLFLPLGNAIATVILPSAIKLVDGVLSLWDELDEIFDESGGSLGRMLDVILDKGMEKFGEFFKDISGELKESKGIFGSFARMFEDISAFLKNGIEPVLKGILGVVGFVMRHLKGFISLYIAFKTAEFAKDALGFLKAIPGMSAVVTALPAITGIGSYTAMAAMGMADGGYVPATEGGQLHILGEGGEGEYVIPESKMRNIGGNITNNFYGYTTEELRFTVRDTIRDEIIRSKYTGGF